MKRQINILAMIICFVLAVVLVTGCALPGSKPPATTQATQDASTPDTPTPGGPPEGEGALLTSAAETIVAELTQNAPPATTPPPPPEGATPVPPTDTPLVVKTEETTPVETATPPPTAAPGVILVDDFTTNTGWASDQNDNHGFGLVDGGYFMYVNTPNATIHSVRSLAFSDLTMQTDARRTSGPESGYYGLICRYQDPKNYYLFAVGSDGAYGIAKYVNGTLEVLQVGLDDTGIIKRGDGTNRVRADCIGLNLRLYVNDQLMSEAQDDSFGWGAIGLAVGSRQESGYWVLFDNFTVLAP